MKNFIVEIEKGLKKETHPTADIKCFVTYVQELPNGQGKSLHKYVDDSYLRIKWAIFFLSSVNILENSKLNIVIPLKVSEKI